MRFIQSKYMQVIFTAALLMLSGAASAFDDVRSGFFIGVGAGLQNVNIKNENGSSDSNMGLGTSFKIGGGITEQFALYYVRNASWFDDDVTDSDSYVFTTGIGGVGGTYYFKPTGPSAYVLGAVGFGDIAAPFAQNIEYATGSAYMLGAGYELSNHKMIEATVLMADIDQGGSFYSDLSVRSIQLTYNYVWY